MDWQLDAAEARVLGSLLEKEIATPEYYPLSLNALVNACNQKSNRDPVVSYDEDTVEQALEELRKKGLALRITRPRQPRAQARAAVHREVQPGKARGGGDVRPVAARPADRRRTARPHRAAVHVRRPGRRGEHAPSPGRDGVRQATAAPARVQGAALRRTAVRAPSRWWPKSPAEAEGAPALRDASRRIASASPHWRPAWPNSAASSKNSARASSDEEPRSSEKKIYSRR